MLDKRQRKRILIFLVIPVLASGLFFSDDLTIRLIIIALLVIYVAFIIFLRDSVRFSGGYSISESEETISEPVSAPRSDLEESFKIVSKNKKVDVIALEIDDVINEKLHLSEEESDILHNFLLLKDLHTLSSEELTTP